MYQFLKDIPVRLLFCAYDSSVLQDFKMFTHILLNFSHSTLPLTEVQFESCVECNYFNDRARTIPKTFPEGCKTKSWIVFRYCKTNILQLLFEIFLTLLSSLCRSYHIVVVTFIIRWRYYHRSYALLSSSLFFQRRFSDHKSSMQEKITHHRICC
jgi:hypothetical protein